MAIENQGSTAIDFVRHLHKLPECFEVCICRDAWGLEHWFALSSRRTEERIPSAVDAARPLGRDSTQMAIQVFALRLKTIASFSPASQMPSPHRLFSTSRGRGMSFQMTEAADSNVPSVHLDGAFYLSQPAFRVMKAQGHGRFVFVASSAGLGRLSHKLYRDSAR